MPLLLNVYVTGRLAVVVGCGPAGREKVERLLATGARVRVVDPQPPDGLHPGVELLERRFRPGTWPERGWWWRRRETRRPTTRYRRQRRAVVSV